MKVNSFEEMSLDGLRDIYDAENKILNALPEMARAASSPELKKAFERHEQQTRVHVERLEQVFQNMGEKPEGKECMATRGLIAEGRELIREIEPGPLLDAALIGAAQKVEHYEIAAYGTARTFAEQMGDRDAAQLLQATLDEEGDTDHKLTQIALSIINPEAAEIEEPAGTRR